MGDRDSIQKQLLDTMKLIAENEAKKIQFDKTVLATVWKIEDESIGKYTIKDQDTFYTAYSSNIDIVYKEKESVYVQIPENNYSNTKIIIGSVNQLGTEYINVIDDKEKVNLIGINCFNSSEIFSLKSSTVTQEKENYIDITHFINKSAFSLYIIQSIGLMISMDVLTSLDDRNSFKGNYGLKLTCKFYDNNEQDVYRTYYLDTPKMVGNPFKLTQRTNQYAIFDMDVDKFQSVEECILFAKDFAYNGDVPDLFISNIEMNFVEALTEEELSSYALNLRTPKGTIFSNASDGELPMLAELKIKGKTATLNSTNSEFYWFVEDASIDFDSYYYSSYGDRGWRCLNNKLTSGATSYFVSGQQEYIVKRKDVPIAESTFKGVVVYNGVVVYELKKFQNLSAATTIQIESSKGNEFFFDAGSTELTCKVLNSQNQEISNNFTYVWGRYDSNGSYVEKLDTDNTCLIEINTIVKYNTFRCSVFNQDGSLYGTGSIILTNKTDSESGYSLVINNSNKLYYYDENGDAPNDPIPQLTLTVYDPKGNEIDLGLEAHKNKWTIPVENTLLVFEDDINLKADTLSYKIAPRFDKDKINNNISLEMSLRGVTLTAETSFIFTKEGDIGTNGTSYYCKLVPTAASWNFKNDNGDLVQRTVERLYFLCLQSKWYVVYISTPDIDDNNRQYSSEPIEFNTNTNYFKALLYKEGHLVESGLSYSWYLGLGSGEVSYNSTSVKSMFNITGDSDYCKISFKSPLSYENTENIIKVRVLEQSTGNIFYSSIAVPIVVDNSNAIFSSCLRPENHGFGFNEVIYNNDGTEPKYTNAAFKVINKDVTWQYSNNNLKILEQTSKEASFLPINPFVSEITNNYVRGYISNDCFIIYPIIMHLNTSGIGMLNDWDGSKYGVNGEDGDYILAPQVGAGIKNTNNMFTGILMGEIRNKSSQNNSNRAEQVGLFGYTVGKQMFSLTPYNSLMKLGQSGNGQIIFDGINGSIESGIYQTDRKGLKIDLKTGQLFINSLTGINDGTNNGAYMGADGLRIGNKDGYLLYNQSKNEFYVKGIIRADTGYIGGPNGWTIETNKIYSKKNSLDSNASGAYLGTDGFAIGSGNKYIKYNVGLETLDIKGKITADEGYIGGNKGWVIGDKKIYSGKDSLTNITDKGTYLGTDGIFIGTQNKYMKFTVSSGQLEIKGKITADEGYIGGENGWTIEEGKIYSGKNSISSTNAGTYLGTNGIAIGDKDGYMKFTNSKMEIKGDITADTINAKSGNIGNWKITNGQLVGESDSVIEGGTIFGSEINGGKYIPFYAGRDEIILGDFAVQWGEGRQLLGALYDGTLDDSPVGISATGVSEQQMLFWAGWTPARKRAVFYVKEDDAYLQPDRWQHMSDRSGMSLSDIIDDLYARIEDLDENGGGGGGTGCGGHNTCDTETPSCPDDTSCEYQCGPGDGELSCWGECEDSCDGDGCGPGHGVEETT